MKKFITLHLPIDNMAILVSTDVIILATTSRNGNTTALITADDRTNTDTKHTYYVNESVGRIKAMLKEAGVATVSVHGCRNNDEVLIVTNGIFSISETKIADNKKMGSVIIMKHDFIGPISCNETYTKIASQL